jgi:hypothetical protein
MALAVMSLSLSAWAFLTNDRLVGCQLPAVPARGNEEVFGCVTASANEYERQNWIAGVLAVAGFSVAGYPLLRRMRTKLATDRDEVVRRHETERQLEAEEIATQ